MHSIWLMRKYTEKMDEKQLKLFECEKWMKIFQKYI